IRSLVGTVWEAENPNTPSRSTRSRTAFMPFVPSHWSSRTRTSSLRPLMPPLSLYHFMVAWPAHDRSSPTPPTGPEQIQMWPTLIEVALTPTSVAPPLGAPLAPGLAGTPGVGAEPPPAVGAAAPGVAAPGAAEAAGPLFAAAAAVLPAGPGAALPALEAASELVPPAAAPAAGPEAAATGAAAVAPLGSACGVPAGEAPSGSAAATGPAAAAACSPGFPVAVLLEEPPPQAPPSRASRATTAIERLVGFVFTAITVTPATRTCGRGPGPRRPANPGRWTPGSSRRPSAAR